MLSYEARQLVRTATALGVRLGPAGWINAVSGQSIFHAGGDLTVVGSVASGAEVAAAGSIHVYGSLRGRAIAGAMGDSTARIFCRRFEAELIAIDGCYQTAEQSPVDLIDKPVQIRLDGDTFEMNVAD